MRKGLGVEAKIIRIHEALLLPTTKLVFLSILSFFFDITLHFIYLTINVSFVVLDDDIKHTGS